MRHLTTQRGLAIAAGATTPAGSVGDVVWSSTENDWLYWNGSAWTNADSGAGGGGATVYSTVVNFGAEGRRVRAFTGINVVGISAGTRLVCSAGADVGDALGWDELEMDPIAVSGRVTAANTVDLIVASLGGPITGLRRINMISA